MGATTDYAANRDDWWETLWQWWRGDALGVLVVGGDALAWTSSSTRHRVPARWHFLLLLGLISAMPAITAGLSDVPLEFVTMALIIARVAANLAAAVTIDEIADAVVHEIKAALGLAFVALNLLEETESQIDATALDQNGLMVSSSIDPGNASTGARGDRVQHHDRSQHAWRDRRKVPDGP